MALTDEFEAFLARREDEWKRVMALQVALDAVAHGKTMPPDHVARAEAAALPKCEIGRDLLLFRRVARMLRAVQASGRSVEKTTEEPK